MAGKTTITLPSLGDDGDAVTGGTIAFWLAKPGDALSAGDDLVEINTDKAAFVVPCPAAGVLLEQLVREDDEVRVGDPLAVLETE